jgi:hypothetical protein
VTHHASRRFWSSYNTLPQHVQRAADASYELLKVDVRHPSLQLKKVGRYWSVRIGLHYRALAVQDGEDLVWFWIGHHSEYDRLIHGA